MSSEYLRDLSSKVETGRGVVPMIDDKAEPLAAVYAKGAAPYFDAALLVVIFRFVRLVRRLIGDGLLTGIPVEGNEKFLFENLNQFPPTSERPKALTSDNPSAISHECRSADVSA